MTKRYWQYCLGLFLFVFIAGCFVEAPIYNINDAAIPTAAGKSLTQEQVGEAVMQGCMDKGWRPEKVAPGHVVATLDYGKLMAKVDIYYSNDNYSIKYKASKNLRHKGNVIHKRYNSWINYLDKAILERINEKIKY